MPTINGVRVSEAEWYEAEARIVQREHEREREARFAEMPTDAPQAAPHPSLLLHLRAVVLGMRLYLCERAWEDLRTDEDVETSDHPRAVEWRGLKGECEALAAMVGVDTETSEG